MMAPMAQPSNNRGESQVRLILVSELHDVRWTIEVDNEAYAIDSALFFYFTCFFFVAVVFFSLYSTSPWWPRWSAPFGLNRAGSILRILPQAGQLWPVHLGCICIYIVLVAALPPRHLVRLRRWTVRPLL